jgi:hypothetical protein
VSDAIFMPDGHLLVPSPGAAGPWFPDVVHGGAIVGLLARAVEAAPAAGPMVTTRLSVDMTRRVPLRPARVVAEVVRDGRRVQSLEARYLVDDEVVARAAAIRIRVDDTVVPPDTELPALPEDDPLPGPDQVPAMDLTFDRIDFVHNFTMHRSEPAPGTAVSWVRLDTAFVAGEDLLPAVRLAIIADMVPSAAQVLDFHRYLSVNPDLSVSIARLPQGEWIGSRAVVRVNPDGHGQTEARLHDRSGGFGLSVKSLLIDRR